MRALSTFPAGAFFVALVFVVERSTASAQPSASKATLTEIVQAERDRLEWHFKGQKLPTYAFGANQFKPYVRELRSLGGDEVLRDAPPDHLHHHGLMYAIRINSVNFWEEVDQFGHERHVRLLTHGTGRSAAGLPQASFTQLIHWLPHSDHARSDTSSPALLVERRTLTLTVDEANEEVALSWHAEFEVGARTNAVRLHGSEYNGLGLRLPVAWERVARHQNSEPASFPNGGKADVVPARWSAVSHRSNERAIQVVLCARPRGHPCTNFFFTMTEPFTYLSATQGLDKTPLEYRAGDRFRLDYLLLVYPDARGADQIEERYQAWSKELKWNGDW